MGSLAEEMNAMQIEVSIGNPTSITEAFAKYADEQSSDALPFYEAEGRILALWDQLNALQLEIALLEAQLNPPAPALEYATTNETRGLVEEDVLTTTLKEAEKECIEARAVYTLKQSVVEDVLITNPILQAVHAGTNATHTERSLCPLVNRRDILSIASTNLCSILQMAVRDTSRIESARISLRKKNQDLAPALISLAREVESARNAAIETSSIKEQLDEEEEESREARKRWRIMKRVVAAVIVGSGVGWASKSTLRDLVIEDEVNDGWH